jgi:CDP-paratose 2-epimerase
MTKLVDAPIVLRKTPYVLVTGGAGFIGANLADRLARHGRNVLIFDCLARDHVVDNLDWLSRRHGSRIGVATADVRDFESVREAVRGATQVYHLAAQVAVTCSIEDPIADFDVNARGTLNVLEAIRGCAEPPPIVFTSTNKVYGVACAVGDLRQDGRRYRPRRPALSDGFTEAQPLDLHSPYGCSKGAADQYVLDYARIFGIPAVVFRMSCVYGPRQFGTEDQGWVAHFLRSALLRRPITIYGTGQQVRDLLFVGDLIDAFLAAEEQVRSIQGRAFNIGGGPRNTASLLEILDFVERTAGPLAPVAFADARPGDQPYYVSDTSSFTAATGWRPRVALQEGLHRLAKWLGEWTGRSCAATPHEEAWACASR